MASFTRTVRWIFLGVFNCIQVFQIVSSSCSSPSKPFGTSYNGTTDKVYGEGTTLSYSCLIGFSLEDSDRVRRCSRDGKWTGRDQVCRINFFDVFMSLMAAVGVVLVFIFLVCFRVYIQGKKGSRKIKAERKKSKRRKADDTELPPDGLLNMLNNNPPGTENPYDFAMSRRNPTIVHVSVDNDSDEGTFNKGLADDDLDLDDPDKHGYETHDTNELEDDYLKNTHQEQEGYLKPSEHKLDEGYLRPNGHKGSKGHKGLKGHERSKGILKRGHSNGPQEVDGYLKPGPMTDMRNASPLYYTPSFAKQGSGWIHDDTSFDSLEFGSIDEELEEKVTTT